MNRSTIGSRIARRCVILFAQFLTLWWLWGCQAVLSPRWHHVIPVLRRRQHEIDIRVLTHTQTETNTLFVKYSHVFDLLQRRSSDEALGPGYPHRPRTITPWSSRLSNWTLNFDRPWNGHQKIYASTTTHAWHDIKQTHGLPHTITRSKPSKIFDFLTMSTKSAVMVPSFMNSTAA